MISSPLFLILHDMIDTIITEFETVAAAFTKVNTFIYERLSKINVQRNGDEYPLIILEAAPTQIRGGINNIPLNKEYFPRMKIYELNLFAFDLWKEDEKATTNLQTKQAEVELLLDQYFAEILKRCLSTTSKGFQVVDFERAQGIIAHDVHNDKIVQANYRIRIGHNVICELGTFNY